MSAPETRVRVTLEGEVQHSVRDQQVLRMRTARVDGTPGPLLLIDTRWHGVTVETLTPAWEWSAGDVVAGETIVYVRDARGVWRGMAPTGLQCTLGDEQVSEGAGKPEGYDVLRYAKGNA